MLTAVLFALATLPPLCRAAAASDPVARLGARAGDEVSVCAPQATLRAPPKLWGTEYGGHGFQTLAAVATTAPPLISASPCTPVSVLNKISPGEAEFYALTNTVTETVTIRQLIEELGVVFASATQVFSDSRTARTLAEHGATTHRTRFIHRRWHFAKFYEQDGVIKISPIRGAVNPANVLTKFTFGSVFIKERKYIMGILHN